MTAEGQPIPSVRQTLELHQGEKTGGDQRFHAIANRRHV
jgi:hypothetical protein